MQTLAKPHLGTFAKHGGFAIKQFSSQNPANAIAGKDKDFKGYIITRVSTGRLLPRDV